MNRIFGVLAITALVVACLLGSSQSLAQNAYVTNHLSNDVSVIATATKNKVTTIKSDTFALPSGVAVTPDGSKVYVANFDARIEGTHFISDVSVIDTAMNKVTATIRVGLSPLGVAVTPDGSKVYVANEFSDNVSVIDTATNTVTATIRVELDPSGVAVTPDGSKVYVTIQGRDSVWVIDTAMNTVTTTIPVGQNPFGVAVTPDGSKVYVANGKPRDIGGEGSVSVIDTTTNTVTATILVGDGPSGVAVTPDGSKVYVTNALSDNVSVIDTAMNTVTTIPVGKEKKSARPSGVAVTPDGSKVYVANEFSDSVSVIDTATNTVTDTIHVGDSPVAFGIFIQPRFAGTPGQQATCYTNSVSALARTFKGFDPAAAALGYRSVPALEAAIRAFCRG